MPGPSERCDNKCPMPKCAPNVSFHWFNESWPTPFQLLARALSYRVLDIRERPCSRECYCYVVQNCDDENYFFHNAKHTDALIGRELKYVWFFLIVNSKNSCFMVIDSMPQMVTLALF